MCNRRCAACALLAVTVRAHLLCVCMRCCLYAHSPCMVSNTWLRGHAATGTSNRREPPSS